MPFLNIFRKKNDDKKENLNNTQNINQNYNPDILFDQRVKTLMDNITNLNKSIRNIEEIVSKLSESFQNISDLANKHESEINDIKNSIEKIMGLYDIISKQYNPFIEDDTKSEIVSRPQVNSNVNINNENNISSEDLPLDRLIKDPVFIAIIIGWLSYLAKISNIEETKKALEYYNQIGWITEEVKIELEKYLYGLNVQEPQNKKLGPEEHIVSLYILIKLKRGLKDGNIYRIKDLYNELVNKGLISLV